MRGVYYSACSLCYKTISADHQKCLLMRDCLLFRRLLLPESTVLGAYKMRFRVSSQQCGGVQRGLNPKWLLLSQHSTVWPVVRIILGSVSGRYSEPSWTCGCGKFVGFSRRVAEESVENPAARSSRALRRRRSPTRHWRFIMRGVVAALRLETLYVKSWEELTIRLCIRNVGSGGWEPKA